MSEQTTVQVRLIVNGTPIVVGLISNPLIDDVLLTEARIQAFSIEQQVDISDRRVSRDIRDYLIRLGVER